MKQLTKLILGAVAGFILGLVGVMFGIALFSDTPFSEFLGKMGSIDFVVMTGIMLMSFLSFVIAVVLQITLHEAGHLVCGLATGYKFVSFRIGSLTLLRKEGRLLFKRFSIAGTGGQCLMAPPRKPLHEISTAWYNAGGVLANVVSATIALILILSIDGMPSFLVTFLVLFTLTGFLFALMNGIPRKAGGIGNDAENMRLLQKNPASKQAVMTQLQVNALVQDGIRLKDMPAEWFAEDTNIDYKDALQVCVRLMAASRYEDMGELDKAYAIFDDCLRHKDELIGLLVKEVSCELLLIALIEGYTEQVDELYTEELKTYIDQYKKVMSSKQALLCAIALYKENDRAKAEDIYETLCRQKDNYLLQGEVKMSLALMQSMLAARNVL